MLWIKFFEKEFQIRNSIWEIIDMIGVSVVLDECGTENSIDTQQHQILICQVLFINQDNGGDQRQIMFTVMELVLFASDDIIVQEEEDSVGNVFDGFFLSFG